MSEEYKSIYCLSNLANTRSVAFPRIGTIPSGRSQSDKRIESPGFNLETSAKIYCGISSRKLATFANLKLRIE